MAQGLGQSGLILPDSFVKAEGRTLRDERARCAAPEPAEGLVPGDSWVDLLAPGLNAACQVVDLVTGLLQKLCRLLATSTHFAMDHNFPALIQLADTACHDLPGA